MAGTEFRALILQHHRTLHLLPLSRVLQGWVCQGHCRRGISVNCCQKRSAKLACLTVGLLPGSQKISNTSRKITTAFKTEENSLFGSSNEPALKIKMLLFRFSFFFFIMSVIVKIMHHQCSYWFLLQRTDSKPKQSRVLQPNDGSGTSVWMATGAVISHIQWKQSTHGHHPCYAIRQPLC